MGFVYTVLFPIDAVLLLAVSVVAVFQAKRIRTLSRHFGRYFYVCPVCGVAYEQEAYYAHLPQHAPVSTTTLTTQIDPKKEESFWGEFTREPSRVSRIRRR